jgi:ATP-dependent DNA helicase RecG
VTSESQNIEFKLTWRDEYLKWICGFANAYGGTMFIGKDDTGNVVDLKDAKKLLEEIPNKVRDTLGILVDVNLHQTNQGKFIEILVEQYPYPVNYKGQYHYRSGSTKQELKGAALDKFLLQKKGKRWDGVPVPNVSTNDLKQETFDFFRKRAFRSQRIDEESLTDSNEHLIENLQLKEGKYLKRASILLFHPNPEKFITGAYIKIGYFESDSDLRFQDEIHGNLFEQIEKTTELLFTKYIKALISYEGLNRVETYEYPKEAIREALLNAVAHKDYSDGVPIQISVYKDKLMIWNEGQLPENWTVKNLLEKHASRPYNPDIAHALFRSGYISSGGYAINFQKDISLPGTVKGIRSVFSRMASPKKFTPVKNRHGPQIQPDYSTALP